MSLYVPYGRFKWLSQKEIDKFGVNCIGENSSIGHMLEIDLEYPDKLHNLHNNYPSAPEKLESKMICYDNIVVKLQITMGYNLVVLKN